MTKIQDTIDSVQDFVPVTLGGVLAETDWSNVLLCHGTGLPAQ